MPSLTYLHAPEPMALHPYQNLTVGREYPAKPVHVGAINYEITDDAGNRLLISNNKRRAYFRLKR